MSGQIQKITIAKILERIDAEIEKGERLSIKELTIWSGYSHRHLQRLFLMETGLPLGKYIRRRRLSRVGLLLRLSRRSLQDIALSVGFDCQQSMSRDFKKNTGLTPRQYRYSPEWFLFPLAGRTGEKVDVSEPERVYLSGSTIVGEAFGFYGTIAHASISSSMNAHLTRIFSRKRGELWMMAQVIPVKHRKYHYQVTGCQGILGNTSGVKFSYPAGNYVKVSFETTRDTHIARTHHIYLNILPESGIIRAPGPEVIVFRYEEGQVFCTLFIPVK